MRALASTDGPGSPQARSIGPGSPTRRRLRPRARMEGLAVKVGVSRSTASRFFSGRPTSLKVTLNIMAALHLKFEHVAKPQLDDVPGRAALDPGGSCARLPVGSPARSDRAASSS